MTRLTWQTPTVTEVDPLHSYPQVPAFLDVRDDLQTLHGQLARLEHDAESCGHLTEAVRAREACCLLAGLLWGDVTVPRQRMGDIGEPLRRIEFDPMYEPAPAEPTTAPTPSVPAEPVEVPA